MGMEVLGQIVGAGPVGAWNDGWVIINPSLPSLWCVLFAQSLSSDVVTFGFLISAAQKWRVFVRAVEQILVQVRQGSRCLRR